MDENKKPLGYISLLDNTAKPVYPFDDFFLNYIFQKRENWESLKTMLNIFIDAYSTKYNAQDGFCFINRDIVVETQYGQYLRSAANIPMQNTEASRVTNTGQTRIEFLDKKVYKPPVTIKPSSYIGWNVSKTKNGIWNSQIWLLAENDDRVLRGQAISNFQWTDERTGYHSPSLPENMMFVGLPRLVADKGLYGNLSQHLLDGDIAGLDDELKDIAEMFKREFDNFKNDKTAMRVMTVLNEMENRDKPPSGAVQKRKTSIDRDSR